MVVTSGGALQLCSVLTALPPTPAGGQLGWDRMGPLPMLLHTRETIASQFFQETSLLKDPAVPLWPVKCFFSFTAS